MISDTIRKPDPAREAPAPRAGFVPWLKLMIGAALILAFIFGVGTLARSIPGARRLAEVVQERNLRATAIYYTDFEEPAEGSERIRDSLDYAPGGRDGRP